MGGGALGATPAFRRKLHRAQLRASAPLARTGRPADRPLLACGASLIASGHNQRILKGDPIAHGERDCLRKARRQASYSDTTLQTSFSACMMCAGTIVQFKFPRLVINDTVNFGGNGAFLRSHRVEVIDAAQAPSVRRMGEFNLENPDL